MENQHRKISGYRELSEEEIATMNRMKALGEQLGQEIDQRLGELHADDVILYNRFDAAEIGSEVRDELQQKLSANDIAKTAACNARQFLQTGMMWLIRSVTKPGGF